MWSRLVLALVIVCSCVESSAAPLNINRAASKPELLGGAVVHWLVPPHAAQSRRLIPIAGDQVGPSFDCGTVNAPLPRLICTNSRLAFVDMLMVQTYQALRAQLDESARAEVRSEALELHQAVLSGCNIPPTGPLTREVERSADCVETHYLRQRNIWLGRLLPDAREEATRSVRRQIELQRLLQRLSFLSSLATVDGVYGPETRKAITEWQRSRGLNETGILGDQHASLLEQAITQKAAEEQRQQAVAQERERERLQQERLERDRIDAQNREQRERAETRQREQQRERDLFQAKWNACKAYQLPACDAALQSPAISEEQRRSLVAWRSAAQQFAGDVQACRTGSIAACEMATKSPAASASDQLYLSQWRDAASLSTRAWKYVGEITDLVVSTVTGAPLSTLIASGIAFVLAAALIVLLIMMRKRIVPVAAREAEAEPEPPARMTTAHNYSSGPTSLPKREARPNRPGAASVPTVGGLRPPHEAPMRPGREPKFVSGGAKGAGVAINIFFPGIGSFFVRRPIVGVCQLGLQFSAALMALTGLLLPVAVVVHFGNWIWAIATAAGAPVRPIQVVIQNGQMPGQF